MEPRRNPRLRWRPLRSLFYRFPSVFICGPIKMPLPDRRLLRRGLGGFFGLASGDLGLQDAVLGAAVDLLFANAVETRGIATSFRHEFLFRRTENALARSAVG